MVVVSLKHGELMAIVSAIYQNTTKYAESTNYALYRVLKKFQKAVKKRGDKLFINQTALNFLKTRQLTLKVYNK